MEGDYKRDSQDSRAMWLAYLPYLTEAGIFLIKLDSFQVLTFYHELTEDDFLSTLLAYIY